MTDMAKKIISGTLRMARGTATLLGLAVMLAVVLGTGATALAAVPGDPFKVGQLNVVNTITRLAGNTDNAMLRINNASIGANATALDLQVKPGKPPMKVNSTTEVQGLNVDSLDSKNSSDFLQESSDRDDFLPDDTYTEFEQRFGFGQGASLSVSAFCDEGDIALGGGGSITAPGAENQLLATNPDQADSRAWVTRFVDGGFETNFVATVRCADFPPLR